MIVKLYHRLARRAVGINMTNLLRITLENRITPLELHALTLDAGPDLDPPDPPPPEVLAPDPTGPPIRRLQAGIGSMARWCAKLNQLAEYSGKTVPEPFMRRHIGPRTWFISNGQDSPSKVLMICFTSNARRMMMPTPVFLQHLDAALVDVILFTDRDRDGFRGFFTDGSSSLAALASKYADRKKYRGIVAMGTSGGGLPAVLVALDIGADAVLSVGGNNPYDIRWMAPGGEEGADLISRYAAKIDGKFPDIYLIYSQDYTKDGDSAQALAEMVSARTIAYFIRRIKEPGIRRLGHTVLTPILHRGTLSSLLNATIFSKFSPTRKGVEEDWSKFMSKPSVV